MIGKGDRAPDFSLPSESGEPVRLGDLLARGPVVIFFYPKDATPGCTIEAGAFAQAYGEFQKAGAEVIGISSDDGASHQKFKDKCGLPYPLLSDSGGKVRKQFGAVKMGLIPARTTYVIDRDGTVRHVFDSMFGAKEHPREALEALSRLPAGP